MLSSPSNPFPVLSFWGLPLHWKLREVCTVGQASPSMYWWRKRQPTPVFLPGESQGWGSPVGYRLWGRTESDTTKATQQQQQQQLPRCNILRAVLRPCPALLAHKHINFSSPVGCCLWVLLPAFATQTLSAEALQYHFCSQNQLRPGCTFAGTTGHLTSLTSVWCLTSLTFNPQGYISISKKTYNRI